METRKSKYDTNPLDPDVERKAEEAWGDANAGDGETRQVGGATRPVGEQPPTWTPPDPNENARRNVYSEAPTRRYDNPPLEAPYPSVFIPPTYAPPAQYPQQQPPQNPYQRPVGMPYPSRSVAGIGIHEKWATMLAYAPYFGIVVSLLELFLVPRKELRVRFHAAQALALHIAFLAIGAIFSGISVISGSDFGKALFGAFSTVFLIISMIRVWRGQPHSLTPLAEPAKWFNEHIEPRNK